MNNLPDFKEFYKTYFSLIWFALTAFLLNFFLLNYFVSPEETNHWNYSISFLYIVFFIFSCIILSILLFVKRKNLDYVGYTFLILTSIKMGISYFILRPILLTTTDEFSLEKKNFFVIFIYFLAIETFLTIRILNKKQ